ncbi:MAG: 50S ribosomal protein L24 [Deltaproteobacteria bacterium]|nr:50S ribosomal protein L24 [Deltaproteobacteria bacterium]
MLNIKTYIKKDDKVKIIVGKDKDRVGKVLKIDKKIGRVIVEKANIVKRHLKPSKQNPQGGIAEKEAPIQLSNIMLMCNKCLKPARIRIKVLEDRKKIRVCTKCGEVIDA